MARFNKQLLRKNKHYCKLVSITIWDAQLLQASQNDISLYKLLVYQPQEDPNDKHIAHSPTPMVHFGALPTMLNYLVIVRQNNNNNN